LSILVGIIRRVMRHARYHRFLPATVQTSNADGSYDVELDEGGSVQGVAPRRLAPALEIVALPGARCLVGWSDPMRPYVVAWSGEQSREWEIRLSLPGQRRG
jgi:hypothetical protein